jgi:hypothetical protein
VAVALAADRAYGIKALPHVVAVDRAGVLAANFVGHGPELAARMRAAAAAPAVGAAPGAPALPPLK